MNLETIQHCEQIMKVASKSFTLASLFFPERMKVSARLLYGWCRYSDDQVDSILDPNEQVKRVAELRSETVKALDSDAQVGPVFEALRWLSREYKIPSQYPLDLLEGMEWDIVKNRYANFKELKQYSYYVAGTVGLMMAHVMGVSDERALRHSVHLGIAMQLTNISRDVLEDYGRGRVYLPENWLAKEGLTFENMAEPQNRKKLYRVVKRLLRVADYYYRSGDRGLRYLPLRGVFSIAVARCVYSDIGRKVRARKARAWDTRAYVGSFFKGLSVLKGALMTFALIPFRFFEPWNRIPITKQWRFL